jgi:hypothetical protein
MWVFIALTGSLTATALFLHAVSPLPLKPAGGAGLFAQEASRDSRRVQADAVAPATWRYIYIHHSASPSGDARSLATADGPADHFIIGNGTGMADGEIQPSQRWRLQSPAAAPRGLPALDRECISICLIGDYDSRPPTRAQLRQLALLVQKLQSEHSIPPGGVFMRQQPGEPAGIGQKFPVDQLRELLRN